MSLPIFIDVDGTLTSHGEIANSPAIKSRVDRVKLMINSGQKVIVWSARGEDYVRSFCHKNDIKPYLMIGKPLYCVDDKPTIRPNLKVEQPEFLG